MPMRTDSLRAGIVKDGKSLVFPERPYTNRDTEGSTKHKKQGAPDGAPLLSRLPDGDL
jgi:hypothetical protein